MKILLINKFFYHKGGAETVYFQELDFLKSKKNSIIEFSMEDEKNYFSPYKSYFINNINFREPKGLYDNVKKAFAFVHSREAVTKLTQLLDAEKPDIAHLHNVYHQLTPSIIPVLKKYGVNIALTLHDYKIICPAYSMLDHGRICFACAGKNFWRAIQKKCQASLSHSFLLALESYWHKYKKSYDGVDIFIAPSQFMANLVKARIPVDKIKLLRNGVDTSAVKPSNTDDGYALFLGRLSIEKGLQTLLKSHALMKTKIPLKIAGTGPLMDIVRKNDGELDGVEFLGHRSGENLKNIIARSSFVVVPSEWNENCSMVVLEAMSHGKPVIGARVGGIPEQIEDGKTGLLFDMGNIRQLTDKMTELNDDIEKRKAMGKAARIKLERDYSFAEHGKRLLDCYQNLLGM